MRPNRLKQLWKEDKTVVNAWVTIPSSWTAEVVAHSGFDAMTIDAQHGLASDHMTILTMLQAISTTDTVPLVRVQWNDPATHMKMLDIGAYGVICPMINTREESERFVGACRYIPNGYRSFGPVRASVYGGEGYFEQSTEEIVTMSMIETAEGLKNVEDIAKTPTMTGLYIGPWDLSIAMRRPKQGDFNDIELLKAFEKVLNACTKNNLIAGIQCPSPEVAVRMSEMGFRFVTAANDTTLLKQGAVDTIKKFNQKETGQNGNVSNPYA